METALLLEMMDVSQERGFADPELFFQLDKQTQLLILAEHRVKRRMQAVIDYEQYKALEKQRRR